MADLKEKLQIAFWLFLHARFADKLPSLFTILRHLIQYSVYPYLTPKEMTITLKNKRFSFKEFTGEISMYKQIFINRIYDSHPEFCVDGNNNLVIFDIGANIGIYTVKITKCNKNCSVYSFEPNFDVYERLRSNIALNLIDNARLFNIGFGDKKTKAYMNSAQSTVLGRVSYEKGQIQVDIDTLDLFVEREDIRRIDIMKIDVEGFELSVLEGADKTLQLVQKIVMECDKDLETRVCTLMEDKGFELFMKIPKYDVLYFQRK